MKRKLWIICPLLCFAWVTAAAQPTSDTNRTLHSIGFHVGYADTYNDERIRETAHFGLYWEMALHENFALRFQAGYLEAHKGTAWQKFDYRGVIYKANKPQLWRDFAVGVLPVWKVTSISSIGLGLGADLIYVKQISYTSDQLFFIPPSTDIPQLIDAYKVETKETLVRPFVDLIANAAYPLSDHFALVAEGSYKISFVGKRYGHGALNSMNTLGVSLGLRYLIPGR